MANRVTRKDVAKMAGVSVTAVSRVMNNSGYVVKEKRDAILKAAEKVGYRHSPDALAIQQRTTRQLLFYNKDLSNAFSIELYRGMINHASKHDYMVLLSGTWDAEKISKMLIDGVILARESAIENYVNTIGKNFLPPTVCASYGRSQKRERRVPLVEADTYKATEIIIDYLFEKGHTKIAFATPYMGENPREAAYRCKLFPILKKSIEDYIFVDFTNMATFNFQEEDFFKYGEQLAVRIYESNIKATAVCCFNDNIAIGMIQQFNRLGINVPNDISVTGIDGIKIGGYVYPKLTTVTISPFEQGSECVKILLKMLSGEKVNGRTSMPINIIEGESVKFLSGGL